jgi:hypothetical protein
MSLRVFVDSAGREWHVFDVVPRENERRKYERRIPGGVPGEMRATDATNVRPERREADRRLTIGGRTHLHSGIAAGWLCFESGGECRRLSPIPESWRTMSDAELDHYCSAAHAVRESAAFNPRR